MASAAFQRFLDELAAPDRRDDAYDLTTLSPLTGDEREQAIDTLIARARDDEDARAALTLGLVGAQRARTELERLAADRSVVGHASRRALVRLGHGATVVDGLVEDTKARSGMIRIGALLELAKVGGDRAVDALMTSLADPDDTARSVAYDGLLAVLGLDALRRTPAGDDIELQSPLAQLHTLLVSSSPALSSYGTSELQRRLGAVREGADPASVDLVYDGGSGATPDVRKAYVNTLPNRGVDLPIAEILAGSPHEQAWFQTLLTRWLRRGDPRIPAGLAALGATWVRPALEEYQAAGTGDAAFQAALQDAIDSLTP